MPGRDAVLLVDTMRSGAPPATILRPDASHTPLPARQRPGRSSTHAAGLAETIELARALGSLAARVIVYAVEGLRYDPGARLSDELAAIMPTLIERLAEGRGLAGHLHSGRGVGLVLLERVALAQGDGKRVEPLTVGAHQLGDQFVSSVACLMSFWAPVVTSP